MTLAGRLAAGEGLVVHCGAGMGRAGTLAAALLMALGDPVDAAVSRVAAARPGAGPQAQVQADLLAALAAPDP
jgi:protein-tyrosine phosphatase